MAEAIGALRAELSANAAQFEQDMGKARASVRTHAQGMRGDFAGLQSQTDSVAGAFDSFVSALTKGLIAGGVAAGVAALIQGFKDLNSELVKLAGNSKTLEMPSDKLQQLQLASKFSGVPDEQFFTGLQSMARLMHDSTLAENDLSRLFDDNNRKLTDRNGKLIAVNDALMIAADLIRNAATEQAKIDIAERVGLTKEWVGWLEKGSAQIGAQVAQIKSMGVIIDRDVVQQAKEFDDQWNKTWDTWVAKGKAAALSVKDWIKNALTGGGNIVAGVDVGTAWNGSFSDLSEIPGRLVSAGAAKKPTVLNARGKGEIDRDPFTRGIDQANKSIAVMNAETATIGLNSEARERARLVAQLEEAAKRANTEAGMKNTEVTDQQRVRIEQLGDAMLEAARKNRETQQQFQSFNQALQFSGSLAVDFFDALGDKSRTTAEVVQSMMAKIKTSILNALILGQGPLAGVFGTASTVPGGTGGIFGGFAKLFAGGFADGGTIPAGHWGVVGENGPEPVFAGSGPLNVVSTRGMPPSGGNITVVNHIDARNADPGVESRIMSRLPGVVAIATANAVKAVPQARRNNPGFFG